MGKHYAALAAVNKKYRSRATVFICIVLALCLLGLVLVIYNILKAKYLFAAGYLIAIILGFTYVFIRINTVFPTYLATDRKVLFLKNWSNDFVPYAADSGAKLLREFLPAKTKLVEIPVMEISDVYIGAKNYIKRYCENPAFAEAAAPFEQEKKKLMQRMDLICVTTCEGECYFMPIMHFDPRDVVKVVQLAQQKNPEMRVHVNSRQFRALRTTEL